jgi:N-methylhydantoinase A
MVSTGVRTDMIRAGSDIGGTFTDVIVYDAEVKSIRLAKIPSSRQLGQAVLDGLALTDSSFGSIDTLVHGSTVVINALLERKGVPTALVTTEGFRDVYEIGRINRPDSFNIFFEKHTPLVSRELRLEVRERMLPDRKVLDLDESSVRQLISTLSSVDVDAIAILLLHSFVNPEHEISLKKKLQEAFPTRYISASHELTREYREYERTSTVVANAYVGPIVDKYLAKLEADLAELQFSGNFYLVQSNGGLIGVSEARRNCISLIESGPASGVVGTQEVLKDLHIGSGVAFDMGGTTAKAGVIENSEPRIGHQYFIGNYNTGLPVLTPVMDIHEVGTGGGSIAFVTEFGFGGTKATVTDANVVLGRLSDKLPLAGSLELDLAAAKSAIQESVARPLDLSIEQAALGIIQVANATMAYSISAVTIERGLAPSDFVLVAYGGAGPLHATQLARELGMGKVIIPPSPGVFSAYGMLFSDPRAFSSRTVITAIDTSSLKGLRKIIDELILESSARLAVDDRAISSIEVSADMRYVGQEHTVSVPVDLDMVDMGLASELKKRFDEVHERTYSHSAPEEPAQIVTLRVSAGMSSDKPNFPPIPDKEAPGQSRFVADVWLTEESALPVPFYAREDLNKNQTLSGPAVIFEETASTLLLNGDVADIHPNGHILINLGGEGS